MAEISKTERDVLTYRKKIDACNRVLEQREKQLIERERQMNLREKKLDEKQYQQDLREQRLDSKQSEVANSKDRRIQTLEMEVAGLRVENSNLKREIQTHQRHIEKLETTVRMMENDKAEPPVQPPVSVVVQSPSPRQESQKTSKDFNEVLKKTKLYSDGDALVQIVQQKLRSASEDFTSERPNLEAFRTKSFVN